jgi:hypothetical protein
MTVIRNGKRLNLKVKVGELKEEQLASAKSEEPGSNWGLQVQSITPEIANQLNLSGTKGVVVRGVQPGSPRLKPGSSRATSYWRSTTQRSTRLTIFWRRPSRPRRRTSPHCFWCSAATPRCTR